MYKFLESGKAVPVQSKKIRSKSREEPFQEAGFVGVGGGGAASLDESAWNATKIRYWHMFRYATRTDFVYMAFAIILAVIAGGLQPLYIFCAGLYVRHALELEYNCTTRDFSSVDAEHILESERKREDAALFKGSSRAEYERLLIATCAAMIFSATLHPILTDRAAGNQVHRIKRKYFASIIRKDFAWFDCYIDRDLPHRIHSDIEEIRDGIGESISLLVSDVVAAASLMSYSIYIKPGPALIFIGAAPLIAITLYFKSRYEQNFIVREQEAYEGADALAGEILCNIRTVKQYEGEEKELRRYAAALPSPWQLKKPIALLALCTGLYGIIPAIMLYIVFDSNGAESQYFASTEEYCEQIKPLAKWELTNIPNVVKIVLVHLCNLCAYHELGKAIFILLRIKRGKKRAGKVFFVIDWKPEIDNLSEAGAKLSAEGENWLGSIEFHAVLFSYPRNPLHVVLQDISFTILPGQMVTFFGKPQSGKSTIVNLIHRLYDPLVGEVRFDDHRVTTLNPAWMRYQLGLVPQETTIFSGTIEDNIRLGRRSVTLQEIMQACREADIHADIVSFPQSYNTMVGPDSYVKFTSYQIMKISLARALLHPSRILIIDGLLSEMDEELERRLLHILESRRGHFTIILTSVKYNSIVANCDVIYTLKNGEIVDAGSPTEIMAKRGPGHKVIQESKEFQSDFKPIFPSQLQAYKFAAAIKRKHDRRDQLARTQTASNLSPGQASLRDKLLHQKYLGYRRLVTPRIAGGFIALAVGNIHGLNPHHFRNIINSALLTERDVRVKANRLHNLILNRRRGSDPGSDNDGSVDHHDPAEIYDRVSQNRRPAGAISSASTTSVHHRLMSEFGSEEGSDHAIDFETRIKHYFGWTVNASTGSESISSEDSNAFWNAYSLSLAKALRAKVSKSPLGDIKELAKFSWPFLLFGALTSVIIGLLTLPRAQVMTMKFEEHISGNPTENRIFTLIFAGFLGLIGVVGLIQELVLGFGLCCAVNAMRKSLLRGFLSREISWFDLPENDIGFLRDSLAADTMSVQMAFVAYVTTLSQIGAILITSIVLARVADFWVIPWSDIVLLFVFFIITAYVSKKDGQYKVDLSLAARRTFQQYSQLVDEAITNAKTVILLGLEQRFLEDHERHVVFATKKLFVFHTIRCFVCSLAYAWKLILVAVAFAYAKTSGAAEIGGGFSIRAFILIYYLFVTIFFPCGTAIAALPNLQDTLTSAAQTAANVKRWKVREEEERQAVNVPCGESGAGPIMIPEISLHKVSFAFPTAVENIILRNFNLKISPGQYVAIVGAAKSGKSCIVDLLNGLYHPTSGSVIIDVWNYRDIKTSCLRRLIGLVKQDPLFLNITIAENIAYGDLGRSISSEEIAEAAKVANIHHLIDHLPEKYNTKLTSLPENPSTFVLRQRLEVARAWIRQPKIVLVDEATVSINPANDELLESALRRLREGRTYVVTSQRIAPIRAADVIVVLQDGVIAEMGTDEELMRRKGLYYEIFVSQQLFEAKYATGGVTFQFSESLDSL